MLEIKNLTKKYHNQLIFENLNLTFPDQGLYFVVGKSGQGKTTLFNLVGKIDRDYQGTITCNGTDIQKIANYQGRLVSYLFQSPTLINELNCNHNYKLPGLFAKVLDQMTQNKILEKLAIRQLGTRSVLKISGGQKSRVALMRSLMSEPAIILCDEPTAALDKDNAKTVLEFLKKQAKNRLVIVITHDLNLIDNEANGVIDLDHQPSLPPLPYSGNHSPLPLERTRHHIERLTWMGLKMDLKTNLKMGAGIVLALVTIMITIVVALGLKSEVNLELNQLFALNSYSSRLKSQQPMTSGDLESLKNDPLVTNLYLLLDEYEFLGVALAPDVSADELVAVADPTKAKPDEFASGAGVVISPSLASRLNPSNADLDLVYLYFGYHEEIKSLRVAIDGISTANEVVDCLYFDSLAPITMVADLFHEDPEKITGSIVTVAGNDLSLEYLEDNHPEFQFKVLGASLKEKVNVLVDNINLVLLLFSGLSLVASLFLIGEIMYLNVLKNRRNLGIFMIMGATKSDIFRMIMMETTALITAGSLVAGGYCYALVALVNRIVKSSEDIRIVGAQFLAFDWRVVFGVYAFMLVVGLLATILPGWIATKQDVKKVLSAR